MDEKIVETGSYRGYDIHVTDHGRFIVVIYGVQYIVNLLPQVKELIDGLFETRRN